MDQTRDILDKPGHITIAPCRALCRLIASQCFFVVGHRIDAMRPIRRLGLGQLIQFIADQLHDLFFAFGHFIFRIGHDLPGRRRFKFGPAVRRFA